MLNGRLVKRRWGWYLTIIDRKHFKVKLLRFNGSGEISDQYHHHRNELWLFLSGSGYYRFSPYGGAPVNSGEYLEIPVKSPHWYRADNKALVLEIQYGEKCIEEDIVRL